MVGAHLYLFAANTTGYGGNGIAASSSNASISLLNGADLALNNGAQGVGWGEDTNNNYYVITDANGAFSITGDYTCTAGQQVYFYSIGGNSGSGPNAVAGVMAVLGACPGRAFSPSLFIKINEVTTVAAAYAFAGFATDATNVSSPAGNPVTDTLAQTGIANAFANAANLADISTGMALATTPGGAGTVPQATINTIADILAACVNSTGASSTGCSTLFNNILPSSATDTATAAIYLAQNPYPGAAQMTNLFGTTPPSSPFAGGLMYQPNDFSLGIVYTGGGIDYPQGIAIDASGDAWIANYFGGSGSGSVTELSSTGNVILNADTNGDIKNPIGLAVDASGNAWVGNFNTTVGITELNSSGNAALTNDTNGGVAQPPGIAIDNSGDAWFVNQHSDTITKLNSFGNAIVTSSSLTSPNYPTAIAVDGSGNAWFVNEYGNSVSELSSNGATALLTNDTNGSVSSPQGIAIDSAGNAWIANCGSYCTGSGTGSVTKLSSSGGALGTYTGGGIKGPYGIAIDGAGAAWIANFNNRSVSEISNSGIVISGSNGYMGGQMDDPYGIAIDGSGNVWITCYGGSTVTELIGAAAPVITPISAGLPTVPTVNGTSNLGTRP